MVCKHKDPLQPAHRIPKVNLYLFQKLFLTQLSRFCIQNPCQNYPEQFPQGQPWTLTKKSLCTGVGLPGELVRLPAAAKQAPADPAIMFILSGLCPFCPLALAACWAVLLPCTDRPRGSCTCPFPDAPDLPASPA